MKKNELILIGGGGHCRSCIDVIEQENKYTIAGIVDTKENLGLKLAVYPYIATDDDLPNLVKQYNFFLIAIGHIKSPEPRIKLFNLLKKLGAKLPVVISPYSYVSKNAQINAGTVIMHHALINAGTVIGANCIINSKALIEHDAVIEDHCHISTGAIINGGVRVGHSSFVGSGAITKQYVLIPPQSFVKANSLYQ